ncbi:uncharacterized protein LY89DRAFT_203730 [Mollisia scopiformis]|uniref:Uncharacterized protein n=1 Tax=Mollisia scopiformis TaxID=149040 RepID=A0A194WWC0_MOLSC|nr:uncharacterized protein LY89DRAFT_203730 [Mollisia scopiformis]KUJ12260.1 hypothetical protein LY89DRAFT_203730 [Mollisia scopiformis]
MFQWARLTFNATIIAKSLTLLLFLPCSTGMITSPNAASSNSASFVEPGGTKAIASTAFILGATELTTIVSSILKVRRH